MCVNKWGMQPRNCNEAKRCGVMTNINPLQIWDRLNKWAPNLGWTWGRVVENILHELLCHDCNRGYALKGRSHAGHSQRTARNKLEFGMKCGELVI